ncbi:MAG: hypothetical protein AAB343_01985 [Patescibacteria group bacterium]
MTLSEQLWLSYSNAWTSCQLRLLQAKHARLVTELAELDKSPLAQSSGEVRSFIAGRILVRMTEICLQMEKLGYRVPSNAYPTGSPPILAPRGLASQRARGQ